MASSMARQSAPIVPFARTACSWRLSWVMALAFVSSVAVAAEDSTSPLLLFEAQLEVTRDPAGLTAQELEEYIQVQQTEPATQPAGRDTVRAGRTQRRASSRSGRSRVPYMIGDTASGTCGTLTFDGAPFADVEHPTFACSRLNIAENNSAAPQDRAFFSYRHFHNISQTNVLEMFNAVEIDLFTLGIEKTFNQGLSSLELRAPIARELNSELEIFDTPARNTLPLSDRNAEFGNLSVVFKRLLFECDSFLISAGVAANIPTADDVEIDGAFDGLIGLITDPIPIDANADFTFNALVRNDTVNLSPYLAWQATPRCRRWFHQGFFQVDIPMNRSRADVEILGTVTPLAFIPAVNLDLDTAGRIDQQTLLRLNLGWGYWLHRGAERDLLRGIAAMFEVHYTATADKAAPLRRRITEYILGPPINTTIPVDLIVGNQFDRINIVNLTSGISLDLDDWVITNGFTAPVTTNENKPFDFEYNLQIQKRF